MIKSGKRMKVYAFYESFFTFVILEYDKLLLTLKSIWQKSN